MELPPPIPPPAPYSCPNCGAALETPTTFCPRCGARLSGTTSQLSVWKIFVAVLLGLVALPTGGVGACLLVMTALSGGSGEAVSVALIGLLFVGVAALCLFGIIKLVKR
jgi:hypothetical protein